MDLSPCNYKRSALMSTRRSFIWLGLTQRGEVLLRKKSSHKQLLHFTAKS